MNRGQKGPFDSSGCMLHRKILNILMLLVPAFCIGGPVEFFFFLFVTYISQGHNFHKLPFSTFQKHYIRDDGEKISVLW